MGMLHGEFGTDEFFDHKGIAALDISVEFTSSGTAFIRLMGNESAGKYRVEGQRIIVEMPNQNSVFTIVDDDTLSTSLPYGQVVLKRKH